MTLTKAGRPAEIRTARRLIQAAGLIFYLLAAQGLAAAGVGVQVFLADGGSQDLLLPITGAILAICYAVVGFHLRRYRVWARNFAFAFAAISLFAFPVGTTLGSLIVLCIDRANRAHIFPSQRQTPAKAEAIPALELDAPLLRFDPMSLPVGAESVG